MGYPVVLKLYSETITHKTDVGGVKLNLGDADSVRNAFREIEASVRAKAGVIYSICDGWKRRAEELKVGSDAWKEMRGYK